MAILLSSRLLTCTYLGHSIHLIFLAEKVLRRPAKRNRVDCTPNETKIHLLISTSKLSTCQLSHRASGTLFPSVATTLVFWLVGD